VGLSDVAQRDDDGPNPFDRREIDVGKRRCAIEQRADAHTKLVDLFDDQL
jgi:hypothetical protein